MLKMGLGMAIVLAPLQLFIGDSHGLDGGEVPAGQDRGDRGALGRVESRRRWSSSPFPTRAAETNRFEIAIPERRRACSSPIRSTARFPASRISPPTDRPPVLAPFFGFRIMVGIGLLMILVAFWGARAVVARAAREARTFFLRVASLHAGRRLHRHPRRLDGRRGRPAAVDRDRHPAHGRRRLAGRRRSRW